MKKGVLILITLLAFYTKNIYCECAESECVLNKKLKCKHIDFNSTTLLTMAIHYCPHGVTDEIEITNSSIRTLDRNIFNVVTDFRKLFLRYNNISKIEEDTFKGISSLVELYLDNNKIKDLHNDTFDSLINLKILSVANNLLKSLHSKKLPVSNLSELYLDHNNISLISYGTFQHLNKLKILNLSHNKLRYVYYGMFSGLKSLDTIDLSYNNLVYPYVYVFYPLRQIREIYLHENDIENYFDGYYMALHRYFKNLKLVTVPSTEDSCSSITNTIQMLSDEGITIEGRTFNGDNVNGVRCYDTKDIY